jgi:ABC-type branched-subunit amino acid transport system substrate-binding protein
MATNWLQKTTLMALAAVPLAACGSSGGGGGSSTPAPVVRGVSDTSITVGGVSDLTSPQGAVFPGADLGAKARFARQNREGLINGRSINFLSVVDDGTDPTKNANAVKQLVLEKKIFALAPVVTISLSPQTSDFLAKEQVPFFGWGVQPGFCGNDYGFGFNGCLIGSAFDNVSVLGPTADLLKPGGTLAIIEGDSGAGRAALRQLPKVAAALGLKIVYLKAAIPDSAPVTDWAPFAKDLMTSNNGGAPDAIHADGLLPQASGLAAALKAAGFKGPIINYSTYVPGLPASNPSFAQAVDGVYTNVQFGPQEQGGPAIQQILDDLKAIGAPPVITLGVATSYWSADMLVSMLKATGRNLTPASFAATVNGGWTYTPSPAGAMGPVTWPDGHTQPSPCAALVQAAGTTYKSAVPFKCYQKLAA